MTEALYRIAIVGAGPGALAVITNLEEACAAGSCSPPDEVYIIAPEPRLGITKPWKSGIPKLITNMPLPTLGPSAADPLGVAKALGLQDSPSLNKTFPARDEVGEAFARMFEQRIARLERLGTRVILVQQSVDSLQADGTRATVWTSDRRAFSVDGVILALGQSDPDNFHHLRTSPYYVGPWEWYAAPSLVGKRVLILALLWQIEAGLI